MKQIKRDEGSSIFEQLSKGDSAQSSKVATQYADCSERILETVNTCFRYFDTHDDTKKTLTTHRVIDGLETLSIRCNETRETICTPIMKFHEETKLFLEITAATMYPLGTKWETLSMELFLPKSLCNTSPTVLISHQKRIAKKKKIFVAGTFYNFTGLRFYFTCFFLLCTQCTLS